jgi:hypothetical protein
VKIAALWRTRFPVPGMRVRVVKRRLKSTEAMIQKSRHRIVEEGTDCGVASTAGS